MPRGRKYTPKKAYVLQIVWGICLLLLVAGTGYGVWHLTRLPSLTIDTVVVTGGDTINPVVIEAEARRELEGTYAALIPRTFTYLYPRAAVAAAVGAVPRVKDVELTRVDKQTLAVHFTEHTSFGLWCDETHDNCLFIDAEGYAFADAPKLRGGSMLRFVMEDRPLLLRHRILSQSELDIATAVARQLDQEFGFIAEEFYYQKNGDITVTLAGGAQLYLSTEQSMEATFNNLETILASENFSHLTSDNFQYIDLRFGNKVFVNEEVAVPEVASSTATTTVQG